MRSPFMAPPKFEAVADKDNIVREDTSYDNAPQPYAMADTAAASGKAASVPIEAGSQQVSVNSNVTWELV